MTRQVWKYAIPLYLDNGFAAFNIPTGGRILDVGNEGPEVVIFWAEVDPTDLENTEDRNFQVVGTGMPIAPDLEYVGTTKAGTLVWHLYEGRRG